MPLRQFEMFPLLATCKLMVGLQGFSCPLQKNYDTAIVTNTNTKMEADQCSGKTRYNELFSLNCITDNSAVEQTISAGHLPWYKAANGSRKELVHSVS